MALEADDLKAAVAAGVIDEAQAAHLTALAHARAGKRAALQPDDEPFELFRGFNEVFVALGVGLLGMGLWAMVGLFSGSILMPFLIGGAAAWWLAEYFTRARRMILPSLLLAIGWTISCAGLASLLASEADGSVIGVIAAAGGFLGAIGFHARFKLPFSIFLAALSAFAGVLIIAGLLDPTGWAAVDDDGPAALFDLRQAGWVGLATLVFGLSAFALAMRFDLSDPHRVSRMSANAFWLHLVAAPAIVNTALLTLFNLGSLVALIALALMIVGLTLIALVIDRRSFLMSALVYLALLLGLALEDADASTWTAVPLVLGVFITILGAGWTRARAGLMTALPDFPGKSRLPPFAQSRR